MMKPIRLVLVDDSEVFLHALRDFLAQTEYVEVAGCATSASEGLHMIEQTKPDLVLMDVTMPSMSGLEATRLICRINGLPRVMLMTAFSGDAVHRQALEAGADALVSKNDLYGEFARLSAQWFNGSALPWPAAGGCGFGS
jgi:DNA-binding NarL/FixJ family response regulator